MQLNNEELKKESLVEAIIEKEYYHPYFKDADNSYSGRETIPRPCP